MQLEIEEPAVTVLASPDQEWNTNSYNNTENKRYQIYALKKAGHSQHEITEYIACSPSTISRELKRSSGLRDYWPKQAQQFSQERRKTARKRKVTEEVYEKIKILIRQELSPQQVVGYMEKHERTSLHHETIYQLVYADKRGGEDLYQHLRIISKHIVRAMAAPRGVTD